MDLSYDIKVLIVEQLYWRDVPEACLSRPLEQLRPTPKTPLRLARLCRVNREWCEIARPYLLRSIHIDVFSKRTLSFIACFSPAQAAALRDQVQVLEIVGQSDCDWSEHCKNVQKGLEPLIPRFPNLRTVFLGYSRALEACGWVDEALRNTRQIIHLVVELTRVLKGRKRPTEVSSAPQAAGELAAALVERLDRLEVRSPACLTPTLAASIAQSTSLRDLAVTEERASGQYAIQGPDLPPLKTSAGSSLFSLRFGDDVRPDVASVGADFAISMVVSSASTLRILVIGEDALRKLGPIATQTTFPVLERVYAPNLIPASASILPQRHCQSLEVIDTLLAPGLVTIGISAHQVVYSFLLDSLAAGRFRNIKHVCVNLKGSRTTLEENNAFREQLAKRHITFGVARWTAA